MKVSELIELLKQMPQDARVEMGFEDYAYQREVQLVSLEQSRGEQYVYIGEGE